MEQKHRTFASTVAVVSPHARNTSPSQSIPVHTKGSFPACQGGLPLLRSKRISMVVLSPPLASGGLSAGKRQKVAGLAARTRIRGTHRPNAASAFISGTTDRLKELLIRPQTRRWIATHEVGPEACSRTLFLCRSFVAIRTESTHAATFGLGCASLR